MPELIRDQINRLQQLTLPAYIQVFAAALILFSIAFGVSVLAAERIFDTAIHAINNLFVLVIVTI